MSKALKAVARPAEPVVADEGGTDLAVRPPVPRRKDVEAALDAFAPGLYHLYATFVHSRGQAARSLLTARYQQAQLLKEAGEMGGKPTPEAREALARALELNPRAITELSLLAERVGKQTFHVFCELRTPKGGSLSLQHLLLTAELLSAAEQQKWARKAAVEDWSVAVMEAQMHAAGVRKGVEGGVGGTRSGAGPKFRVPDSPGVFAVEVGTRTKTLVRYFEEVVEPNFSRVFDEAAPAQLTPEVIERLRAGRDELQLVAARATEAAAMFDATMGRAAARLDAPAAAPATDRVARAPAPTPDREPTRPWSRKGA